MRYIVFSLCFLFLASACQEEFDPGIPTSGNDIVFDGILTNELPPYFFRLSRTSSISEPYGEGIENALIVITDVTAGITDTLLYLIPELYTDEYHKNVIYTYYDYHEKKRIEWEALPLTKRAIHGGVYVTTKIYGLEGHTYMLNIEHNGKQYKAEEKMIPATPITKITLKELDFGVKGSWHAPCISFKKKPDEPGYYLLQPYGDAFIRPFLTRLFIGYSDCWPYSILDDSYLPDEVEDFVVSDGQSILGYAAGWHFHERDDMYVQMHTISEQCYQCYEAMIKQIRNDGGAYTPRPVTPVSNISGGVLGCFHVSAVSEKHYIKK